MPPTTGAFTTAVIRLASSTMTSVPGTMPDDSGCPEAKAPVDDEPALLRRLPRPELDEGLAIWGQVEYDLVCSGHLRLLLRASVALAIGAGRRLDERRVDVFECDG